MTPDINEHLSIKNLHACLQRESLKLISVLDFQSQSDLEESCFIMTLRSIEKKEFIDIGFLQRGYIVKVKN